MNENITLPTMMMRAAFHGPREPAGKSGLDMSVPRAGGALRRSDGRVCPLNRASAPCRSRPTRLADGLELESAPVATAVQTGRHNLRPKVGSPVPRPSGRGLGYTGVHYTAAGCQD